MEVTKEIKKQAKELASKFKAKEIFVNESGEFFTEEVNAKQSVKGNKDKYAKVDISSNSEKSKESNKADELIAAIEAAETAEAVQDIIDAETEGKKRTTVLEAGAKKLETFKAAE